MNERIMELAIEARKYAETKPDIYSVAYDKKFAELIVQECVNVLHDNELWSRDVSHVLKEHFGVEE